jgi:serine/threonine-protein kinase HipA
VFDASTIAIADIRPEDAYGGKRIVLWSYLGPARLRVPVDVGLGPDGLAIAPFYDLVSVVEYDTIDHELAMAYGDEFELEGVTPLAWADFAGRTGLQRAFVAREMTRMARAAQSAAAAQEQAADYEAEERALVARIGAFVQSQARKLLAMAKPMQTVDPALR